MNPDYLTLEETARLLKKSTQTIRRMIKKGELKAQRVRTPQGFHYVVHRADIGLLLGPMTEEPEIMFSDSPIQNLDLPQYEEHNEVLINQNENPTNQTEIEPILKPLKPALDKIEQNITYHFPPLPVLPPPPSVEMKDLLRLIDRQHREQLGLIQILEQLQRELFWERQRALQKPKTLWDHLRSWLNGN